MIKIIEREIPLYESFGVFTEAPKRRKKRKPRIITVKPKSRGRNFLNDVDSDEEVSVGDIEPDEDFAGDYSDLSVDNIDNLDTDKDSPSEDPLDAEFNDNTDVNTKDDTTEEDPLDTNFGDDEDDTSTDAEDPLDQDFTFDNDTANDDPLDADFDTDEPDDDSDPLDNQFDSDPVDNPNSDDDADPLDADFDDYQDDTPEEDPLDADFGDEDTSDEDPLDADFGGDEDSTSTDAEDPLDQDFGDGENTVDSNNPPEGNPKGDTGDPLDQDFGDGGDDNQNNGNTVTVDPNQQSEDPLDANFDDNGDSGDGSGNNGDAGQNNNQPPSDQGQDGNKAVTKDDFRKFVLYKKFMELYNSLVYYVSKLEYLVIDDYAFACSSREVLKNFDKLTELLKDYMIIKFKSDSYLQNVFFFEKMKANINLNIEILKNNSHTEKHLDKS